MFSCYSVPLAYCLLVITWAVKIMWLNIKFYSRYTANSCACFVFNLAHLLMLESQGFITVETDNKHTEVESNELHLLALL